MGPAATGAKVRRGMGRRGIGFLCTGRSAAAIRYRTMHMIDRPPDRQTDRQTDKQTHRQTDRQTETGRQAGRQAGKQADILTD